jgi:(p)ppGpp synthase/HD superfamily hydrolase
MIGATFVLNDALGFAKEKHANQKYGDASYFMGHIVPVYNLVVKFFGLEEFGNGGWSWADYESICIAAILHDVVEDCGVSVDEIRELYGDWVARIVEKVTDAPGANRKERKAKTYAKIAGHKEATIVKLCDRIHNMSSGGKLDMYIKEYPEFKAKLNVVPGLERLWAVLDSLAKPKEVQLAA